MALKPRLKVIVAYSCPARRLLESRQNLGCPGRAVAMLQSALKAARVEPWLGRLHPFTLSLLNSLALHMSQEGRGACLPAPGQAIYTFA